MFVDSHCHLNFEDFGADVEAVIQRAQGQGITTLLTICCTLEEGDPIVKIARSHPRIFCTLGVHPHEAQGTLDRYSADGIRKVLEEKAQDPKVVGVGECGLDYYYENSPRKAQLECFEVQLETAKALDLPLSIHTREAEQETLRLLKAADVRGVIHCFSGTEELAKGALDLGFYLSLSGIVTFPKAQALREIVKTIPLDRLLLETDAPFLAPVPQRGKRNEPAFLTHTAACVADLKGVSVEDLAAQTTRNFFELFSRAVPPDPVPPSEGSFEGSFSLFPRGKE